MPSPIAPDPRLNSHDQDIQLVSLLLASAMVDTLMPRSQNFNEIMPAIYARFMEKEARQWRQIYKVSCCLLVR